MPELGGRKLTLGFKFGRGFQCGDLFCRDKTAGTHAAAGKPDKTRTDVTELDFSGCVTAGGDRT